jgi:hypothetical protein
MALVVTVSDPLFENPSEGATSNSGLEAALAALTPPKSAVAKRQKIRLKPNLLRTCMLLLSERRTAPAV